MVTVFLPEHSFTFSFGLSIFYYSFSKGYANLKLQQAAVTQEPDVACVSLEWA